MKSIDRTSLIISFIALVVVFSIVSIIGSPAEIRFSWQGINPWNTVSAVPLMFKRFISLSDGIIYTLSVLLIAYLWWRIYALINKIKNRPNRQKEY
ncbi:MULTISPECIES: hypothetical protein [Butyricimonas]|uniref:hypothetical protein n=1 Tax=Butyricimonas TaxID=574697 RepID=UPI0007FB4F65|nr:MULTISPECIES: hypothetical protein [Butyricimonas]